MRRVVAVWAAGLLGAVALATGKIASLAGAGVFAFLGMAAAGMGAVAAGHLAARDGRKEPIECAVRGAWGGVVAASLTALLGGFPGWALDATAVVRGMLPGPLDDATLKVVLAEAVSNALVGPPTWFAVAIIGGAVAGAAGGVSAAGREAIEAPGYVPPRFVIASSATLGAMLLFLVAASAAVIPEIAGKIAGLDGNTGRSFFVAAAPLWTGLAALAATATVGAAAVVHEERQSKSGLATGLAVTTWPLVAFPVVLALAERQFHLEVFVAWLLVAAVAALIVVNSRVPQDEPDEPLELEALTAAAFEVAPPVAAAILASGVAAAGILASGVIPAVEPLRQGGGITAGELVGATLRVSLAYGGLSVAIIAGLLGLVVAPVVWWRQTRAVPVVSSPG